MFVKYRLLAPLLAAGILGAAYTDYASCRKKLDQIGSDRLRNGTREELTPTELTAYAIHEAPAGVRDPRVRIVSPGVAAGSAMIDFGKVRRAQGHPPGWLMSKLLDGERPVSVTALIRSDNGRATVDVQRVDISGIEIDGRTLDFLIRNVLLAMYPNAAVGRPFELGHNIRRIDVEPRAVGVVIGR
jgi:hypothetical protein